MNMLFILIGSLAFLVLSAIGFVYFGIYFFSKKNIFFSPIIKGEIKVATISGAPWKFFGGVPPGKFINAVGVVAEGIRHIDPKTGVMRAGELQPQKESLLSRWFKVAWIGLWPYGDIHRWTISYSKWSKENDGGSKLVVVKDKPVESLHVLPTFGFIVIEAETKDKIRLDIEGKYTLSLVDAMASLFTTKNWQLNTESALLAAIVDFVKMRSFDEFLAKPMELGKDPILGVDPSSFVREMLSLNLDDNGNKSIKRYGFVIEDVNITSVEIAGSDKDVIAKATTALALAKKNAEAAIENARGAMESTKNEAKGLKALCTALGINSDQIGLLKIAEAIAKHNGSLALGGSVLPTMDMGDKRKEKVVP